VEIFRIHRVLEWRKPLVYELSDLADEVIDGIFYEQELARVEKNLQEEEFIVDHVIKNRGRGSNKQLLVSWRGYPNKFNTWIPASSLTRLRNGEGTISHFLPSNSSMRYFPENIITSFITELPHIVHLHGEWEVALNEI